MQTLMMIMMNENATRFAYCSIELYLVHNMLQAIILETKNVQLSDITLWIQLKNSLPVALTRLMKI